MVRLPVRLSRSWATVLPCRLPALNIGAEVRAPTFSQDGHLLAAGTKNGVVRL
ncbi:MULTISPECIES: hypothetical protein [Streptomyces]|uniref:hypothetical protein n=1 Tax=Streptomyces TaxID=1883 RepID=UPI0021A4B6AA|nr:hypothetical protein [Streptomyces atratus]MCT2546643.1 hypothetical protein [Streptomyces atratus]